MAQGDKRAYTGKQKRKAEHIEAGYRARGVSEPEAERRAWATVNQQDGGGKRSGSARQPAVKKRSSAAAGKRSAARGRKRSAR